MRFPRENQIAHNFCTIYVSCQLKSFHLYLIYLLVSMCEFGVVMSFVCVSIKHILSICLRHIVKLPQCIEIFVESHGFFPAKQKPPSSFYISRRVNAWVWLLLPVPFVSQIVVANLYAAHAPRQFVHASNNDGLKPPWLYSSQTKAAILFISIMYSEISSLSASNAFSESEEKKSRLLHFYRDDGTCLLLHMAVFLSPGFLFG